VAYAGIRVVLLRAMAHDKAGYPAAASGRSSVTRAPPEAAGTGAGLPQKLRGVPDALRAWWARAEPAELERTTLRSGRSDVLAHVSQLLRAEEVVLDLGCGPGLLAKEAKRRDIVGLDMEPAMVKAARTWMDHVLEENLLEHYPVEPCDTVVLCNVLEPYPREVRRLVLGHAFEFLRPGGRVVLVMDLGRALATDAGAATGCGGFDLVFPEASGGKAARPEEIEEDLILSGFDLDSTELLTTKTLNHTAVLPGEEPKAECRSYAVLVGRSPA
jgi:SAM-dependent methyltransferase